jgi:predicted RNA-binding Zn ribbon-like protein
MNRPDLCLEFVNTRFWRGQAEPTETLKAPEDLAGWTAANGGPRPAKPPARREFERAIELRETLHRLFDAESQDKTPAARDLAGDLLAGPRLDRVRRCANPECGWLFLDDSRAGKRRWCSMQSCGNRAKARRHYHKSRADG